MSINHPQARVALIAAVAVVGVTAISVVGLSAHGSHQPTDVSTTASIDPLAQTAALTPTSARHDSGSGNSAALWSKRYTAPDAPADPPVCVTVLTAAARLGYVAYPRLGVTAANCVAKSGQLGIDGTIVTTPSGQDITLLWTLTPATVTMTVTGPQP